MRDLAKNLVNLKIFPDNTFQSIKYDNKDRYEFDIPIMQGNYKKLYDAIKYIPGSYNIDWRKILEYYQ